MDALIASLSDARDPVRARAASALGDYGADLPYPARLALLRALAQEKPELRPTLAWALLLAREPRASDEILRLLATGQLQHVARADGSPAFDLARVREYGAALASDEAAYGRYVLAVRDGLGATALLAELEALPPDAKAAWYRQARVFDAIDAFADPRAKDALVSFIERKPHPHFQTRAALALAALGDLRAVPFLAQRLRMDPLTVYGDEQPWEVALKRDDSERVRCARLLADLADSHPEALAELRAGAEDALIFWLRELPAPHANGLRALAAMGSTKNIAALRAWANPSVALPARGALPPMQEEWVIAQSALRYAGRLRDKPSWSVLLRALERRPKQVDVTMDALMSGGVALLGMSLRALGVGAVDGLSEWGDARAFAPILKYVEDPLNNEQSRFAACAALGWVAKDNDFQEVVTRVLQRSSSEKKDVLLRACLLETLQQRTRAGHASELLPLLEPQAPVELRHAAARAIARAGIDAGAEAELFARMRQPELMTDAALALLLGGSADSAARALAAYGEAPPASVDELTELWSRSFGFLSDEDVASGGFFRTIERADALTHVTLRGKTQAWPRDTLRKQLDQLVFDNGPHSVTRVVLSNRLWQLTQGSDTKKAASALRAFYYLRERGRLAALASEPGALQAEAQVLYRELSEGGS